MSNPGPDPHRCTEDCHIAHCPECKEVDHLEYCPTCDNWFCSVCRENNGHDAEPHPDHDTDERESQLDAEEDHLREDR